MSVEQTQAVFYRAAAAFGLSEAGKIAVAVSGGADSTALCLLTRQFVAENSGEMIALIVDHGLRPCSTEQARLTVERLTARGIRCRILTWEGEKPSHGIEQAAREARYRLLAEACKEENCSVLLLGHHRQDQAETFLIRKARGSGAVGLAGMSAIRKTDFGRILRPLLSISPADLREYNRFCDMAWVEDETNLSDDFDRGRLRRVLTPEQIETAFRQTLIYGKERQKIEKEAAAFVTGKTEVSDRGYLLFPKDAFYSLSEETALFCLGDFLRFIADRPYAPRLDSLKSLLKKIRTLSFGGVTLGGCRIAACSKNRILIWRELSDLPASEPVAGRTVFCWDRFAFRLDFDPSDSLVVAPLKDANAGKRSFPKRTFCVLPALFDNEGLFIAPHLGYKRTKAGCQVAFTPHASLCKTVQWTSPVM
ncbi:MAG: tRNA lysidine(34) synthetase TilS [Alphaproteobacteria bacterium]|nr:tRNA lysidine(34) synthetase TilS [Alphaproteobacteria bacterium]